MIAASDADTGMTHMPTRDYEQLIDRSRALRAALHKIMREGDEASSKIAAAALGESEASRRANRKG